MHGIRVRWNWKWIAAGAGVIVLVAAVAIASIVPFSSDALKRKVVATLEDRFDAKVELQQLTFRLLPMFHATASGLTIRHHGRRDVPPLLSAKSITVDASLPELLRKHVSQARLDGLDIAIPPDYQKDAGRNPGSRPGVVIDNLVTTDARLAVLSSKKGHGPKVWKIHHLHMRAVSFDQAMPFQATVTNAVPPGDIETSGAFGPWSAGNPGRTPLEGRFTFDHADLGVFDGISGELSAHGRFDGSLEQLDINGETDTPKFTVTLSGQPVPLHTRYHALVDATNGNTHLERIDASFLDTSLVARGAVVDTPGVKGRTIKLDVQIDRGRVEDVLRLAVKAPKPPMTGGLKLSTTFLLPPGKGEVADRLHLDGDFTIKEATFTGYAVQDKIDKLSHHSRGQTGATTGRDVASNFHGAFTLANGRLKLDPLTFAVPGATVRLAGTYALRAETLDFHGSLLMDAKVSRAAGGVKGALLKLVDPLFDRKGGGSRIPIKVTGKRDDPSFGLDVKRVLGGD